MAAEGQNPKIVVSYRRSDSAMAGRIFDRLVQHFGKSNPFIDIDNVPFGVDFRKHIDDALQTSDLLIAMSEQLARVATRRQVADRQRGRSGSGRAGDRVEARAHRPAGAARRRLDAGPGRASCVRSAHAIHLDSRARSGRDMDRAHSASPAGTIARSAIGPTRRRPRTSFRPSPASRLPRGPEPIGRLCEALSRTGLRRAALQIFRPDLLHWYSIAGSSCWPCPRGRRTLCR
jgi:hypothetical protein